MRKMRYTRSFIVAALLLAVCLPARAQFAGEDKTILRLPDNSQTVKIGKVGMNDKSNVCYEWSGPHIEGNNNTPVITVHPISKREVYKVRKMDDCGVLEDVVIVTLEDTVSIVKVTPSQCFNTGDTFKIQNFNVVTNPPGYESMITIFPEVANNPSTSEPVIQNYVNFNLEYDNHISHASCLVNVVNYTAPTPHLSPALLDFEKNLQKAEEAMDLAKKIEQGLAAVNPPGIDCKPYFNNNRIVFATSSAYCCNGEVEGTWSLPQFGFVASFNCEISWPIPYVSIPALGTGIYATIGIGAGLSMGPLDIVYRGECSYMEIPAELYVEFSGGARAQILTPNLCSLSAKVTGRYSFLFGWRIGKPFEYRGFRIMPTISGEAKLIGCVTIPYRIVLGTVIFK